MLQGEAIAGRDGAPSSASDEYPGDAAAIHDLGDLIEIAASAVNDISRSSQARRDSTLAPMLARARAALVRAGALVRSTTSGAASRIKVLARPDLQSIASCLDEIRGLLAWICEPDVALTVEFGPDLPLVCCNRIELQNVVLNLVTNAREATQDGGSIEIIARRVASGAFAGALELIVRDDGVGMSHTPLPLAFSPYFTTKAEGQGTGLGLALVQRFADDVGGRLDIASAPGHGARVTLRLPPAETANTGR